jgi:hypothetical protein
MSEGNDQSEQCSLPYLMLTCFVEVDQGINLARVKVPEQ